jgi:hypothetical protein
MLAFHRLIHTRAPSTRLFSLAAPSAHPVHDGKIANHLSNHNLTIPTPRNLLQSEQKQNCAPHEPFFRSRNTHRRLSQQTTNHKQQTPNETKPPSTQQNLSSASKTRFSASRAQYFLTKQSHRALRPLASSFKSSSLHVSDRATPWAIGTWSFLGHWSWTLVIAREPRPASALIQCRAQGISSQRAKGQIQRP